MSRVWLGSAILAATTAACMDLPGGEIRRAAAAVPAGEPKVSERAMATLRAAQGGSPVSLDSALTLFRIGLTPVDSLEHAEKSVERLLARFTQTLERSDTAALRAIVMTRREFAYLYYPTSPFTRASTKQEPGLAWFLHLEHSQKGATRLMNRYGGRPLRILRNECKPPARMEGSNVLWDDCRQTVVAGSDTVIARLFGGVYERDGRFKIFSYSNDL